MNRREIKFSTVLLLPFTLLYGMVISIRNLMFDYDILKSHEFNMPVISVGNITVGGTGKTPHIEYLVRLLKSEYKLATLSRGYKRKSKGFKMVNRWVMSPCKRKKNLVKLMSLLTGTGLRESKGL